MTEHLYQEVDNWYDSLNDAHAHIGSDSHCNYSHYPRFAQYFYTYLSVIEEFSNDVE